MVRPRPTSRRRQARGRADRAVGEIAASGYVDPRLGAAPRHPVPAGGRFECRRTAKEARDGPSWAHYVSGKQARESSHCRGVARFQPLALGNSGGSVSAQRCPYPNGDMRLACFLTRHAVKSGRGRGHRGFLSSGEDSSARSGALAGGSLIKRVSSVTNFAVVFLVARSLGAVQFGAFSLAYIAYGFALNLSRGLGSYPFQVRYTGAEVAEWRRGVAESSGTALMTGILTGCCMLAAATVLSGATRSALSPLG